MATFAKPFQILGLLSLLWGLVGCGQGGMNANLEVPTETLLPSNSRNNASHSCQVFSEGKSCENAFGQYVEYKCGCDQIIADGWAPQNDNCFHRLTGQDCRAERIPTSPQCEVFSQGKWCDDASKKYIEFSCGCQKSAVEGWVDQGDNCYHRVSAVSCGSTPQPIAHDLGIGIPRPSFGLSEVKPVSANEYVICPSCNGANDFNNTYGTREKPRLSMPSSVNGPAIIYLHGEIHSSTSFLGNGTSTAPIYVTSLDISARAYLTTRQTVRGSYIIVEGLSYGPQNASDTDFGVSIYEGSHHIAFRNNLLRGNSNRSGGIALGSWGYTGSNEVSDIVIDQNDVQNIGNVSASSDQDAHCLNLNGSAKNIWITRNTLAYCSGDGVQIEAQTGRSSSIHHIYVGKNHMHHNRQSGGWVKNASHVIFSQNKAHDFRANSGGPGACFGHQYGANYIWYLFNEASECNIGFNVGGTDANSQYAFLIGNLIHDLNAQVKNNLYQAGAINIRGTKNVYVVNNTMSNVDGGATFINDAGLEKLVYWNNIVHQRTSAALFDFNSKNVTVDLRQNIFSPMAKLAYNNSPTASVDVFQSWTGAVGSMLVDPLFESGSYRLQNSSPAIHQGIDSAVFETFQNLYGQDIRVDFAGKARSSNPDLGAFEK